MSYCKHHVPVRICKTNYPLKKKELTRGIAVGDLDQSSNSKLRCNHRSNSSRIDSPDAFPRFHAKPTRFTTEAHRLSVSLSRKPKPFSAAVTIALRPFPSSKRRRFARKKSRISDLSLPLAVPLGAGCSWSLESSTLSLSPSLFLFPSHGSLTTRRESIRDRRRSVDSQRARRRPGIRRPVTGNRSCRPHWPANHPKSRVRHVCNADPGKPEPPAAPTTYACLPRPARPCRYQDTAETYSGLSAFIIDTPDVLRHFYRRAARIDFQIYGRRARLGRDECPVALPRIPRRNLKGYQVFHDPATRKISFVEFLRRYSHVSIDLQSFEKIGGSFDSTRTPVARRKEKGGINL